MSTEEVKKCAPLNPCCCMSKKSTRCVAIFNLLKLIVLLVFSGIILIVFYVGRSHVFDFLDNTLKANEANQQVIQTKIKYLKDTFNEITALLFVYVSVTCCCCGACAIYICAKKTWAIIAWLAGVGVHFVTEVVIGIMFVSLYRKFLEYVEDEILKHGGDSSKNPLKSAPTPGTIGGVMAGLLCFDGLIVGWWIWVMVGHFVNSCRGPREDAADYGPPPTQPDDAQGGTGAQGGSNTEPPPAYK